jgi:hypothetical protein
MRFAKVCDYQRRERPTRTVVQNGKSEAFHEGRALFRLRVEDDPVALRESPREPHTPDGMTVT